MSSETLKHISKIIERESKTSTYKFALLRGTIDIIQQNRQHTRIHNDRIYMPMGILINKWIFYYFPLLESENFIPQMHGSKPIVFKTELESVIKKYNLQGGISALYNA
jgi:hypothetical protein